jgi:peptide/nickel transport system permease protein
MGGIESELLAPSPVPVLGPTAVDQRDRHRSLWAWLAHPLTVGVSLMGCFALVGLVGPFILSNPNNQDLNAAFARPGTHGHLLGTDALGRDVAIWIVNGIRTSFIISSSVVLISALIGVSIGLVAGYFGRIVDGLLMRLVDLTLAIPPLLLFIAASAAFQPRIWTLILLLCLVAWLPYARLTRTRVQTEREQGFVAAARLAGSSHRRILLTHLLPTVSTVPIVLMSLQFGYVLLWESGLSFVGYGVRPPAASLGYMIAQGRDTLASAWWLVLFPGLAILAIVISANILGDGLRRLVNEGGV